MLTIVSITFQYHFLIFALKISSLSYISSPCLVASVDLVTTSTTVTEGNSGDVERVSVEVCVQLVIDSLLPLDREVVVLLTAIDSTAG